MTFSAHTETKNTSIVFFKSICTDHPNFLNTMAQLTVTARGRVTLKKEVLQHLGIRPGEKIELDLLPDGRGMLQAARQTGSMADFISLLAGRTNKVASLEEINAAVAQGWGGND